MGNCFNKESKELLNETRQTKDIKITEHYKYRNSENLMRSFSESNLHEEEKKENEYLTFNSEFNVNQLRKNHFKINLKSC